MIGSRLDLNFSLPNVADAKSNDIMMPGKRKIPWGFDGYKIPPTVTSATFVTNGGKFCKSKLTSFIDEIK